MDASPSPNGFKPATGIPLHWVEIGRLVKEFMTAKGNTVTLEEVRKELADAGVPYYSEASFDKWYKRLFVKKEPRPVPEVRARPEPRLSEFTGEPAGSLMDPEPTPEVDDVYCDRALSPFIRFVGVVGQIGGIAVAERYLKAMRELSKTLP